MSENVTLIKSDPSMVIALSGRIDSHNAQSVEGEINSLLESYQGSQLTLDAKKLDYISSAGLRILLRLKQKGLDVTVDQVSAEVFEIFEMTGFSELLKIVRAYKEYDVEGCPIIGTGANGNVYRYDEETVIKVYKNDDALAEIERERELARTALVLGLPTAISYDVGKVGDKFGSVFELLNAKSFCDLLIENPSKIDQYVVQYVDLMKKIHAIDVSKLDLPSAKANYVEWAGTDAPYLDGYGDKLVKMLNDIPDSKTLLHGDLQIKNIMFQNEEALLIDMDTLTYGDPIFEFAGIFMAFIGFGEVSADRVEGFFKVSCSTMKEWYEKTLRLYYQPKNEEQFKEIYDKIAIVGYTRGVRRYIFRGFPEKLKHDYEVFLPKLKELVMKYNDLSL